MLWNYHICQIIIIIIFIYLLIFSGRNLDIYHIQCNIQSGILPVHIIQDILFNEYPDDHIVLFV